MTPSFFHDRLNDIKGGVTLKIKIIEDETLQETCVVIHCRKRDEDILRMIAKLQLQEKNIIGTYRGEDHLIPLADILYIDTMDKHVFLYSSTLVYETTLRLYEIEEQFMECGFFRANKSTIINFQKIRSLRPDFDGRIEVTMENEKKLYVSRQYAPILKQKLGVRK